MQGWLIRDPSATGPPPLLLDVHGGPHNAWNGAADDMHLYHQELAARGWTVLLVNPRGSDGYGEEFYNAVFGAWGEADAKDFLEPIDQLVAEGLADPERLAVTGYSYGGYMTCYLTSHDHRFAAAVAGGVVSDLTSMGGTSDDGALHQRVELGGHAVAAGRERYAAMSPYTPSTRSRTPTLVLHGADDCAARSARPSSGTPRCASAASRPSWCSTRAASTCSSCSASRRTDRLQPPGRRLGRAVRRPRRPRRAIDAAHWQRRLAALAERHKVPGAQLGILRYAPAATTSW